MPYDGHDNRFIRRHHLTCISVMYRRKRLFRGSMTDLSRPCEINDINWRGLRFYSPRRLRRGSVIEMEFDCPIDVESSENTGQVKARVVWRQWSRRHRAWRTGVQFTDVTDKLRDTILHMIDKASAHQLKYRDGEQDIL